MIFDTHAHYDDRQFDTDREELLNLMKTRGIGNIVNAASDYESLEKGRQLTRDYDFMYCTAGIHPTEIEGLELSVLDKVREYALDDKCLAIGEIGLDYHWVKEEDKRESQKTWFRAQLDLAKELNMPVVIHSRDACEDTVDILRSAAEGGIICDIHCFSYSVETAVTFVKMGFYIGVGGVLTYKNARKLVETVERIPLARILTETDCPYLAPSPFRGERNDSATLPYVIRRIAEIKGLTESEVIEVTENNAKEFYRLRA